MRRALCGRLRPPTGPKTSAAPAARMKSKAPNERPFSACWTRSSRLTPRSLPRVGHLRDLVKDRVHGLPARRLHLAKVDVLDRVVRRLVEREIAARALERDVPECLRE